MFTSIAGRPLDDAAYRPVFAEMAKLDLPIWLHPGRTAAMTDYAGEAKSRYEMWWCFGWPYDTSVAMSRLVFSGLFDRHPAIKIVTHHCGGMIPYFDGRVGAGLDVLGSRTSDEDYSKVLSSLKRPHLDYFRDFYADTAMFGGQYGIACGLEFFGPDKVVFATDTPLGPIKPTIEVIDRLGLERGGPAEGVCGERGEAVEDEKRTAEPALGSRCRCSRQRHPTSFNAGSMSFGCEDAACLHPACNASGAGSIAGQRSSAARK